MHRELKARLFSRACDIVGSRERLAERLGVEAHALEFWLAGRATPPERVFLAVVDLVLADDIARACQDRRQDVAQRALVGALRARAAPPIEKLP
jgi:DNA-binding transcriptional regulator YdaS (Cro superfamily)